MPLQYLLEPLVEPLRTVLWYLPRLKYRLQFALAVGPLQSIGLLLGEKEKRADA
jgi:hypothetical protein